VAVPAYELDTLASEKIVREIRTQGRSDLCFIFHGNVAINPDFVNRLVAENTELCKILVSTVQTARRNDSAKALDTKKKKAGREK
jgi:hypothetical protein